MTYEAFLTQHLAKECGIVEVTCPNEGCGVAFKRENSEKHIEECKHLTLTCENCEETYKYGHDHNCIRDLKARVKDLEAKMEKLMQLVEGSKGLAQSAAAVPKMSKILPTGMQFYKQNGKVFCARHRQEMPRLEVPQGYMFHPYSGSYACDNCRRNNGINGQSAAYHCRPCTMDVCAFCVNDPNVYQ